MKIAIIDSGVENTHTRLNKAIINGLGFTISDNNEVSTGTDYTDQNGHGTAIAAIIHKHCPEAELSCLKIFQDGLIIHEHVLYKAIEWCLNNEVNLINLSLGIVSERVPEKLFELCQAAYKKNIVVISASNNVIKDKAYPAYFPNVFGVACGQIKKSNDYGYLPESPIEFLAKGTTQRVAWKDNSNKILQGTSYACAHFTGIAAKIIKESGFIEIDKIKEELKESSDRNIQPLVNLKTSSEMEYLVTNLNIKQEGDNTFKYEKKFNWIKKIAIFPATDKELALFHKFPECVHADIIYNSTYYFYSWGNNWLFH